MNTLRMIANIGYIIFLIGCGFTVIGMIADSTIPFLIVCIAGLAISGISEMISDLI